MDARAAAIGAWCAVLLGLALLLSEVAGLKYVQDIIWPTDLYAFQHIDTGPIDVALIGSSRTTFGLAPTAIDACLQRRLGRATTTYNLSRVYASMFAQRVVARDLLAGERVPKIAVIEVAPEILSDRHHEHTYNMASQVGLADVPECLRSARTADDLVACSRAPLRGVDNLAWLLSGRYRDVNHLTWMMLYHRGGQFCFGSPACEAHNARYEDRLRARWEMRLEKVLPQVTEERFADWSIGEGLGHRSLMALLSESEERGYRPILVNMPVHQRYQDEIPPEDYATYLAYLDGISAEHGVMVYDASTPEWRGDRTRYYDPDHLSVAGARRLSEELCESVLAPALQ